MRRGFTNRAQPLPELDEFCLNLAKSIVGDPEGLKVASVEGSQLSVVELDAPPDEIGRVVGRDGRTVAAIRTLAEALAMRMNRRVMVDVQAISGGRSRDPSSPAAPSPRPDRIEHAGSPGSDPGRGQ